MFLYYLYFNNIINHGKQTVHLREVLRQCKELKLIDLLPNITVPNVQHKLAKAKLAFWTETHMVIKFTSTTISRILQCADQYMDTDIYKKTCDLPVKPKVYF